jgi:hypothetical protein
VCVTKEYLERIRSFLGKTSLIVAAVAMTACSGGASEDISQTGGAALSRETTPPYLALGDSIAFGDDGHISWTDPSRANAANFVGYPFHVAQTLYGSTTQVYDLAPR